MRSSKPLAELNDGELADRWGDVKVRSDADEKRIDALKEEFGRRGLDVAKGARFKVIKDTSSQNRFDVKAARDHLGADAKKFEKPQQRTTYLVRPVEAA